MPDIFPCRDDITLFHQGTLHQSYKLMGAHLAEEDGASGTRFTVWAPNARSAAVCGSFNGWNDSSHRMTRVPDSGVWTLFIPDVGEGTLYKYAITGSDGAMRLKSDPYAFFSEIRPHTASIVHSLDYEWRDASWHNSRQPLFDKPLNIYEVHLGSWRKSEHGRFYTYEQYADELVRYVKEMNYTHIELLPLTEHPFDGSWGYQTTGYYSATSRYGTPQQLMHLVDRCHEQGIGVIMDWVPGHYCKDEHGLRLFDGTPQYEPWDLGRSEKWKWGTLSFDFGKPEVKSFLFSNAVFWADVYHIDGIRIDAVASMTNLNFDKGEHEKIYNEKGGTENLEAIALLRELNTVMFRMFPNILMIAEDSSDWAGITAPVHAGGYGFNYKWKMGWMNDTLRYMETATVHRKYHHNLITFSMAYAYAENFVLPLSHDEVVHGKRSLINKMPGDYWQKFANLRLLYSYLMSHPGKKLLFMGGEIGQFDEWKDREDLDWEVLDYEKHRCLRNYVRELNTVYLCHRALWQKDHDPSGFKWIDADNAEQSVVSFFRSAGSPEEQVVVIMNFTERVYHGYRLGVPRKGVYQEILNSDSDEFGGSNQVNPFPLEADDFAWNKQPCSISITLPPLGAAWFRLV